MSTYYTYHHADGIGELLLVGDGQSISLLGFPKGKMRRRHEPGWIEDPAPFKEATRQLDAYFAGELQDFDLPLAPEGTPFQQKVWKALQEIPYGATWNYRELAERVDSVARAVGHANARNPIPVIIPCHRVIGADGSLTGFGGGLDTKQHLLNIELRKAA